MKAIPSVILMILLLSGSTACATIRVHSASGHWVNMSQDDFAHYVEHVFRYHNQVMNRLLDMQPASLKNGDQRLLDAEDKMISTCHPMNEIVSAEADGMHGKFWDRMALGESIPACEAATQAVEALLPLLQ